MSPIRKSQRDKYPANWTAISKRIRFERAEGRCECRGECGYDHSGIAFTGARCEQVHGEAITGNARGSKVVLTVAHLDHNPTNSDDENLKAMCQRCHLAYDLELHAQTRARGRGEPL